eukprot:m.174907 g.174907  ORF g.174907 m.174907 type:complete len:1075 (+) comp13895_c0_seq1:365-3589(+)
MHRERDTVTRPTSKAHATIPSMTAAVTVMWSVLILATVCSHQPGLVVAAVSTHRPNRQFIRLVDLLDVAESDTLSETKDHRQRRQQEPDAAGSEGSTPDDPCPTGDCDSGPGSTEGTDGSTPDDDAVTGSTPLASTTTTIPASTATAVRLTTGEAASSSPTPDSVTNTPCPTDGSGDCGDGVGSTYDTDAPTFTPPTPAPTCRDLQTTFDAGFGSCSEAYAPGQLSHRFCRFDIDTATGCSALQSCAECSFPRRTCQTVVILIDESGSVPTAVLDNITLQVSTTAQQWLALSGSSTSVEIRTFNQSVHTRVASTTAPDRVAAGSWRIDRNPFSAGPTATGRVLNLTALDVFNNTFMSQANEKVLVIITDGLTQEVCGAPSRVGQHNCVEMAARQYRDRGWEVVIIAVETARPPLPSLFTQPNLEHLHRMVYPTDNGRWDTNQGSWVQDPVAPRLFALQDVGSNNVAAALARGVTVRSQPNDVCTTSGPTVGPTMAPTAVPTAVPSPAPTACAVQQSVFNGTFGACAAYGVGQPGHGVCATDVDSRINCTAEAACVVECASSHAPTSAPTAALTASPTSAPSLSPTHLPSTQAPTGATSQPTNVPTSASPVAATTQRPSSMPTTAPTAVPTTVPTMAPTSAPTTLAPATSAPTVAPTFGCGRSPDPPVCPTLLLLAPCDELLEPQTGVGSVNMTHLCPGQCQACSLLTTTTSATTTTTSTTTTSTTTTSTTTTSTTTTSTTTSSTTTSSTVTTTIAGPGPVTLSVSTTDAANATTGTADDVSSSPAMSSQGSTVAQVTTRTSITTTVTSTSRTSLNDRGDQARGNSGDDDDDTSRMLLIILIVLVVFGCCLCCLLVVAIYYRRNKSEKIDGVNETPIPAKAWAWDTEGERLGSRRSSQTSLQLARAEHQEPHQAPVLLPGAVDNRRSRRLSSSSEPPDEPSAEEQSAAAAAAAATHATDADMLETPTSRRASESPRGLPMPPGRGSTTPGRVTDLDELGSPAAKYKTMPAGMASHAQTPDSDVWPPPVRHGLTPRGTMRASFIAAAQHLNNTLEPVLDEAAHPASPTPIQEASFV